MMQVWSNDQFVAPLHRVVASKEAARFSAPFFYSPSYDVQVEPIVVKPGDVPNYRPISWCQFRLARFQGNYADLGKENQIGDYKIHGPIDFGNS
ncbi:putative Fe2OG dioxygenase domain-containing protein [Phytophthora infestans]|uniref:Putative Fe2OG dioxygenase domain-containing protein n=1 Tax=Phytophthora infestans TaxID=4787 RepID=A0A833SSA9_PHYIN|nr:putative Fe2OG dioxygenase domain-containing protein [Phytophthora infestans]KAF4149943.1 putative Fe2OG dioxygenase domain-containing protein [Phytophthora infestans]